MYEQFGKKLIEAIEIEKQKEIAFHSLVIGSSGNQNAIKCFNHNWVYDNSKTDASRRLIEQLYEIKKNNY